MPRLIGQFLKNLEKNWGLTNHTPANGAFFASVMAFIPEAANSHFVGVVVGMQHFPSHHWLMS
jgi:hypothetical protein